MSEKRGICLRAEGREREREREERSADHRVKPFHKGMKEKDRNAAIPENKFGMSEKLRETGNSSFKLNHDDAQSVDGHDVNVRYFPASSLAPHASR